ncbi:MAG: LAGLIDADG family homing endonuclease [Patescibacteria group bacterium]
MTKRELLIYLAGFLDADGSIYVRLKPNVTYKYDFQIAPSVVLFQKETATVLFEQLRKRLGVGYIRKRNDGIIEFTIGDRPSIRYILQAVSPFLLLKQKQAKLMLQILDFSEHIQSPQDFVQLAQMIDQFGRLNYSKKRTVLARVVRNHLRNKGILTP